MVSKRIEESINDAKEALDNIDSLGRTAFDICDGILTNNKALVHDEIANKKIAEKEQKVYDEYQKRVREARVKLKNSDPYYQWDEGLEYYMKLRRWKSMEMISFWDKLSKEHDI